MIARIALTLKLAWIAVRLDIERGRWARCVDQMVEARNREENHAWSMRVLCHLESMRLLHQARQRLLEERR